VSNDDDAPVYSVSALGQQANRIITEIERTGKSAFITRPGQFVAVIMPLAPGEAESRVLPEWGMRHDDCLTDVHDYGRDEQAARQSVADHARLNGRLVRRTVTYTQWEEVPGE